MGYNVEDFVVDGKRAFMYPAYVNVRESGNIVRWPFKEAARKVERAGAPVLYPSRYARRNKLPNHEIKRATVLVVIED